MDETPAIFSETCLEKIEAWRSLALELDKDIKPHTLIYLNEEGYQERAPGPSQFVAKWVEDYKNRKDIYDKEELIDWLKLERERELKHLKNSRKEKWKKYYRLFLKLITSEIRELGKLEQEEDSLAEAESLLKEGELEACLEKLDNFVRDQQEFEDEETEILLIQSRLNELEKMYADNSILIQDYLQQKAQIRKTIILLMRAF